MIAPESTQSDFPRAASFGDGAAWAQRAIGAAIGERPPARPAGMSTDSLDGSTLRRLIDQNADGMVVIDAAGRIRFANAAAETLFGRTVSELQGSPFGVPIVGGGAAEIELRRPDGRTCYIEMRAVETAWRGQPAQLVSLRDVTERVRLESTLHQAQKMEALGRLAGGVAHEFNSLLTSILCAASTLVDDTPPGDPRRHGLDQICAAARRAADITDQLLTISRRRPVAPERIDVQACLGDMERMLRRLIGERIDVRVRNDAGRAYVEMGRGGLAQVLLELALNARDAMPTGGVLSITATRLGRGGAAKPDGTHWLAIRVHDTGRGMDSEALARLFEPFSTTTADSRDAGLGLATVFGVVQHANGRILASSTPDQGTTIEVLLPLSGAGDSDDADPTPAAPPSACILVADDDESVREVLAESLRRAGFRVIAAVDGAAAWAELESRGSEVDLLISDVVMPRMLGTELARRTRDARADTPILLMSGYPADAPLQALLGEPRVSFLPKPFTHTGLLAAVGNALSSRTATR